jgi:hypothetical protein
MNNYKLIKIFYKFIIVNDKPSHTALQFTTNRSKIVIVIHYIFIQSLG